MSTLAQTNILCWLLHCTMEAMMQAHLIETHEHVAIVIVIEVTKFYGSQEILRNQGKR